MNFMSLHIRLDCLTTRVLYLLIGSLKLRKIRFKTIKNTVVKGEIKHYFTTTNNKLSILVPLYQSVTLQTIDLVI